MSALDRRSFLAGALALPAAPRLQEPRGPGAAADAAPPGGDAPGRTPHTRFAMNAETWFTALPFLDRIVMAAELGFPAVEFWSWRDKDVGAIQDVTADLELTVANFTAWGGGPGMNAPQNHRQLIREVKESTEIARRLRCKRMTVVAGDDVPGLSREEMHANVTQGLKLVAPIAETADVTLLLEPLNVRVDHPGHCLHGSEDALRICRAVGSTHVKLNWDLYHMQVSEGDLCRRLEQGFDQVGYLQLADNPGRHEPGTGEVRWPRVLRAARELGYDGFVGLECRPLEDELTAARRVHAADTW